MHRRICQRNCVKLSDLRVRMVKATQHHECVHPPKLVPPTTTVSAIDAAVSATTTQRHTFNVKNDAVSNPGTWPCCCGTRSTISRHAPALASARTPSTDAASTYARPGGDTPAVGVAPSPAGTMPPPAPGATSATRGLPAKNAATRAATVTGGGGGARKEAGEPPVAVATPPLPEPGPPPATGMAAERVARRAGDTGGDDACACCSVARGNRAD